MTSSPPAASPTPIAAVSPRAPIPHLRLLLLSVAASVVTVALKVFAWRVTGSVGLLSDAVESTANVAAALTALLALWYAAQPADRSHPYGHEKIEFFASGIEGGLIFGAGLTIAITALRHLSAPSVPSDLWLALPIVLIATLVNYGVGQLLVREGRRVDSIVLEADGGHLLADVWTSIAIVTGLILVKMTGLAWLDPVLALGVALNIARIGAGLLRRSFDGLMDRALSDAEVEAIRAAIEAALQPGTTYHALRTRRAGAHRFADFHLLVPGAWPVRLAHDCEMDIARQVEAAVHGIEVTTHIEPVEEPAAYNDYAPATEESAVVSHIKP